MHPSHDHDANEAERALVPDTSLAYVLRRLIANAPEDEPEEEDYDDTESAYANGLEVASYATAKALIPVLPKAEALDALLNAAKAVEAWLERDVATAPMAPVQARLAQGWARGQFGAALRAAIAKAEGR